MDQNRCDRSVVVEVVVVVAGDGKVLHVAIVLGRDVAAASERGSVAACFFCSKELRAAQDACHLRQIF